MTQPSRLLFATAFAATVLAGCSPDSLQVPDELTATAPHEGALQPSDGLPGGAAMTLAESVIYCTGEARAHYAPPLGPTPREHRVTVREVLGTFSSGSGECTGPVGGGHSETTFMQEAGCLISSPDGILPTPDVMTYHWDTGTSSTIRFTVTTVVLVAGQSVVTKAGTVIEGFEEGAPAVARKVTADLDIQQCLEGGIEETGPNDLILAIGDVALE